MAGEWVEITIGEVLTLQRGFDLPQSKRVPGNYPVIASTGQVGEHEEAMVSGPGVVIGRSGSLGGGQYIERDFWPLNTTLWVRDFKGNDPRFCYYLLRLMDLARFNVGSGVPTLNRNHVHPLPVRVPVDVNEQRAIAHILGTLDDKIELNRRMNETLEAIARALFKSWFVDFDPVRAKAGGRASGLPPNLDALFPDSFEDSERGEIPARWSVGSIGEVAEVVDCLHSKKPRRQEVGRLLLQLSNILDHGLVDVSDPYWITDKDYERWTSRIEARPGDCVITNVGRVGAAGQIPPGVTAALGRNMTGVRVRETHPYPTFLISALLSEAMREEIAFWTDSGSVMDSLNVRNIPKLRFALPSEGVLKAFEGRARPLRAMMEANLAESRTLAELRDTLLPKLISGEVRVEAAQPFAETHA